jgi:hypothetical protein
VGYKPSPLNQSYDYVIETMRWLENEDEREAEEREQEAQERGRYTVDPVRFPAQTSRRAS